jgi:hypothetical protein
MYPAAQRRAPAEDDRRWPRRLLEGYEPSKGWQHDEATPKQIEALRRRGLEPPDGLSKGAAMFVLNQASPKQLALLRSRGLYEEGDPEMTFGEATGLLNSIARREGWGAR